MLTFSIIEPLLSTSHALSPLQNIQLVMVDAQRAYNLKLNKSKIRQMQTYLRNDTRKELTLPDKSDVMVCVWFSPNSPLLP